MASAQDLVSRCFNLASPQDLTGEFADVPAVDTTSSPTAVSSWMSVLSLDTEETGVEKNQVQGKQRKHTHASSSSSSSPPHAGSIRKLGKQPSTRGLISLLVVVIPLLGMPVIPVTFAEAGDRGTSSPEHDSGHSLSPMLLSREENQCQLSP